MIVCFIFPMKEVTYCNVALDIIRRVKIKSTAKGQYHFKNVANPVNHKVVYYTILNIIIRVFPSLLPHIF